MTRDDKPAAEPDPEQQLETLEDLVREVAAGGQIGQFLEFARVLIDSPDEYTRWQALLRVEDLLPA